MDDLISRQEVIRLILERGLYCDTQADREISAEIIRQLPSAQPETHEERTETHGVCLDVIDRQATLDWLKNEWNGMIASLFDGIKALPSAQPEHTSNNDCNGCKFVGCYDTDFPCANCIRKNKDYYAPERRTDE